MCCPVSFLKANSGVVGRRVSIHTKMVNSIVKTYHCGFYQIKSVSLRVPFDAPTTIWVISFVTSQNKKIKINE